MKKSLYILAELSDRDFDWLVHSGKRKEVSAGTVLIREGQPTDALYLVLSGTLTVLAEALEGRELARLTVGEVVGEMSFVDTRPPSATVKAAEDSVVWTISRSQLAVKLSQDNAFAAHFYRAIAVFLSDRLRETMGRLSSQQSFNPPGSVTEPELPANLELAKLRLDWLIQRLRDTMQ
jgi:CRP-like cAMP-binding protein